MRGLAIIALCASLVAMPLAAYADEHADKDVCKLGEQKGDKDAAKDIALPEPLAIATPHKLSLAGANFDYTATAGIVVIKGDDDKPIANIGYIAYTKNGVKTPSERPLLFAFNGGPGSASIWLHMGAIGPRRVVTTDGAATPPAPYNVEDNPATLLDKADLVFIDPVGTGVSKAVCGKKDEDFWAVDPDIESFAHFIYQYVSENHRWNSAKYLMGESYGTTRGAAIVDYLESKMNLAMNGVVLVSVATDLGAIFATPGNDRPYPLYLPSFAAVALYYKLVVPNAGTRDAFVNEVRDYALGPYTTALAKGDALSDAEIEAVAQKLHEYTGLSVDYLKKANLRVNENMFTQELLRSRGATVARLDARFTGFAIDKLAKEALYDPQSSAVGSAFAGAFLDYYQRELKFPADKVYKISNGDTNSKWKWSHKLIADGNETPFTNTTPDLAHALSVNPNLRVLVLNGYYDLATPFTATQYVLSHLGIDRALLDHVELKYYDAGHMMYLQPASLKKMKGDLDAFIDRTSHR